MVFMEVGAVCIKTRGKEAGRRVVILSETKKGKVLIDGPKVKRKECNALHLFPLNQKVEVKKEASHDEVVRALKK